MVNVSVVLKFKPTFTELKDLTMVCGDWAAPLAANRSGKTSTARNHRLKE
jgi:hypothetical protein